MFVHQARAKWKLIFWFSRNLSNISDKIKLWYSISPLLKGDLAAVV